MTIQQSLSQRAIPRTILHVTECYEGGVGRAIRNIVRILPHETHLLLARGSGISMDAHLFDHVTDLPANPVHAFKTVQTVTRKLNPHVVHAHSSWAGFYTRLLPLPSPVVYEPHCYAFEDVTRRKAFRALFWFAEYLASHRTASVLTLSPREERLANQLNASTPVHSLPNVPTLPVLPPLTNTGRPSNRSVYMIGRAAPQKDPLFFVQVTQEVRCLLDDVEFVWIGDGELSQIDLLERHDIRVTGWLEQAEIAQELRQAGVYVHSAAYEGFPLSVLDAASQGVPIVAREIPCFDGTSLVRAQSPLDMAHKVVEALTDMDVRESVVARGYELLKYMNETNQVKALERAYAECRS